MKNQREGKRVCTDNVDTSYSGRCAEATTCCHRFNLACNCEVNEPITSESPVVLTKLRRRYARPNSAVDDYEDDCDEETNEFDYEEYIPI